MVGLAVDYLTRFMSGASPQEAFEISLRGASNLGEDALAAKLLAEVKGLEDSSITNAIKLTRFDVYYRAGLGYKPVSEIKPDQATIQNVRTMVERSLHFLKSMAQSCWMDLLLKAAIQTR